MFHDEQFPERVRGSLARLYEEVEAEAGREDSQDGGGRPRTTLKDRLAFLERIRKISMEETAQASSAIQDARAVMLSEGAVGRAISDPFFPLLNFVSAVEDEGLELFSEGKGGALPQAGRPGGESRRPERGEGPLHDERDDAGRRLC